VIANINGRPYEYDLIKDNLYQQIISSVRWIDSVQYMLQNGVEDFEEIGYSKVLKGLIRIIKENS
jgi:malonyl CoA-acyl carrier protein transacylase